MFVTTNQSHGHRDCTLLSLSLYRHANIFHTLENAGPSIKIRFHLQFTQSQKFCNLTPVVCSSECQSVNIVISKERKLIHFSEAAASPFHVIGQNGPIDLPFHGPTPPDNIKFRIFDLVTNQLPAVISLHYRYFRYLRSKASCLYRSPFALSRFISEIVSQFPLSTTYLLSFT